MGWWSRVRARSGGGVPGSVTVADAGAARAHLAEFARTRRGVEAYIEPPTHDTPTTVILIATDGEWTRRAAPSPDKAWELARSIGIPVYDVRQTGYPARMREWSSRQRKL